MPLPNSYHVDRQDTLWQRVISTGQGLFGTHDETEILQRFAALVLEVLSASQVVIYAPGSDDADHRSLRIQSVNGALRMTPTPLAQDPALLEQLARVESWQASSSDEQVQVRFPLKTDDGTGVGAVQALMRQAASGVQQQQVEVLAGFCAAALLQARRWQQREMSHRDQVNKARLNSMSELAAAIAHQLNNPLTTILADTEMLLMDAEKGSRYHSSLEAIFRGGRRAAEVVNRLLAVAHTRTAVGMAQPVQVEATIDDVLEFIQSYIRVEGIQISKSFEENLPMVWVAPDALGDVWLNLLMNARDAVLDRPNPQIGIEARYDKATQRVEVVVWDNGAGIDPENWDAVFQPFYTTKPPSERIGLGLHISRQILQGANGAIQVGHQEGGGARFTVYLPTRSGR